MYLNNNYSEGENSEELANSVHSIFWQLKELDLKNVVIPDVVIVDNINSIISKTLRNNS